MLEMIMSYAKACMAQITDREEGQALVEYALILALVALVAIGALTALGGSVSALLQGISDTLAGL
jgi:pilus assembly protein Flp/PilA